MSYLVHEDSDTNGSDGRHSEYDSCDSDNIMHNRVCRACDDYFVTEDANQELCDLCYSCQDMVNIYCPVCGEKPNDLTELTEHCSRCLTRTCNSCKKFMDCAKIFKGA